MSRNLHPHVLHISVQVAMRLCQESLTVEKETGEVEALLKEHTGDNFFYFFLDHLTHL